MGKLLNVMEEARQSRALFLLIAVVLNMASLYFFTLFSLKIGIEGKYFPLIIAVINGFLVWFFMHESNKFQLFIYSVLFTYLSWFLYQYLIFMHYYHWESNLIWDKSVVDNSLIIKYITSLGKYTLESFFEYFTKTDSVNSYLFLAVILAPLFQYKIYPKFSFDSGSSDNKDLSSKRIIKRRFK